MSCLPAGLAGHTGPLRRPRRCQPHQHSLRPSSDRRQSFCLIAAMMGTCEERGKGEGEGGEVAQVCVLGAGPCCTPGPPALSAPAR